MRQTQVVVIPWCDQLKSYPSFNSLLEAINGARRSARDYFTDIVLEKLNDANAGVETKRDWV